MEALRTFLDQTPTISATEASSLLLKTPQNTFIAFNKPWPSAFYYQRMAEAGLGHWTPVINEHFDVYIVFSILDKVVGPLTPGQASQLRKSAHLILKNSYQVGQSKADKAHKKAMYRLVEVMLEKKVEKTGNWMTRFFE